LTEELVLRGVVRRDDVAGEIYDGELVDHGTQTRVSAAGPILRPERETMPHLISKLFMLSVHRRKT
jgi:hypothetical protein